MTKGFEFFDVHWLEKTGSTNQDALEQAKRGAKEGLVIVADEQTDGRGRLGRKWHAEKKTSLLLSVLLRPKLHADEIHLLVTALAVSTIQACVDVVGFAPQIKWPNDLVIALDGKTYKLAGILAETIFHNQQLDAVVIGMGLNISFDDEQQKNVIDLVAETSQDFNDDARAHEPIDVTTIARNFHLSIPEDGIDKTKLLNSILNHFGTWYGSLTENSEQQTQNNTNAEILMHYAKTFSGTIGSQVKIMQSQGAALTGKARDITRSGTLVVEDEEGLRHEFHVGDVIHLRTI